VKGPDETHFRIRLVYILVFLAGAACGILALEVATELNWLGPDCRYFADYARRYCLPG